MSTNDSQDNQSPAIEQVEESVGDLLSEERVRQGLTAKDVADRLHITMHYVRSIEANSFEKLPGTVFAKGYIKSYALLLGLDVDLVLKGYNEFVAGQQDAAREKTRIQVRRRKDKSRLWVSVSLLSFAFLFLMLWLFNGSSTDTDELSAPEIASSNETTESEQMENAIQQESVASVSPQQTQDVSSSTVEESAANVLAEEFVEAEAANIDSLEEESLAAVVLEVGADEVRGAIDEFEANESFVNDLAETEVDEPAPVAEVFESVSTDNALESQRVIVEAEGSDILVITFRGESWVEVSDGSEALLYRDLQEAGNELEVRGAAPFNVLLGDAPFATLTLNGTEVDFSNSIRIDNSARLKIGL